MPFEVFKTAPAFINNERVWIVRLSVELVCEHAGLSRCLHRRLGERLLDPSAGTCAHAKTRDESERLVAVTDLGRKCSDNSANLVLFGSIHHVFPSVRLQTRRSTD